MEANNIARIMARHILAEEDLGSFAHIPDAVMAGRNSQVNELKPLATAEPEEILQAFGFFGLFATAGYLMGLAGQRELRNLKPVFMAACKMGQPDRSWEDIAAYAEQADLQNPQVEVAEPYYETMKTVIRGMEGGRNGPDDLPYIADREYLNAILCVNTCIGCDREKAFRMSTGLLAHVVDQCEQKPALTQEDELRYAGMLALACKTLPGASSYYEVSSKTLLEHLEASRPLCAERLFIWNDEIQKGKDESDEALDQRMKTLSRIIDFVGRQADAGNSLFVNPVGHAIEIYNNDLMAKIESVLAPAAPAPDGKRSSPGKPPMP